MTVENYADLIAELCDTCLIFGQRGWCRATSGNFSARIDAAHCLITQSGREKSTLNADDLMICDLEGNPRDNDCRPSAETPLHTLLYRLDEQIGAVLHTHSITATVLSRAATASVDINGFEMQKAMLGITSHEQTLTVPVFDNSQDMTGLAAIVGKAWADGRLSGHGFLIRGHGLYAWGSDLAAARRHVEGLEFLFGCVWQEILAGMR
jgi:methylthioribulose-1-phosphate dehydratase